jgi:hypothetical protein
MISGFFKTSDADGVERETPFFPGSGRERTAKSLGVFTARYLVPSQASARPEIDLDFASRIHADHILASHHLDYGFSLRTPQNFTCLKMHVL